MAREYRYRDAEFLRKEYVEQRRSAATIADNCDVSASTISRWLERHGIDRDPAYQNESWLREQYCERGRKIADIAADCGVGKSTISYWLGRHDITERESLSTTECETCGRAFRYYPSVRDGRYCSNECAHEPTKRQVTVTCPNCDTEFQRRASLDTEYCSPACWSEDLYPGTDRYTGRWYRQRRNALERDNRRCTICGISEKAHQERAGQGLDVHHSVPVRLFDRWGVPVSDAHELRNLVTVCRSCHFDIHH